MSCGEIVIKPILGFDDERLHGERTGEFYPDIDVAIGMPPLPVILITLYYDGPEYGYPKAPVAPYVEATALMEQSVTGGIAEDFWDKLSKRHN